MTARQELDLRDELGWRHRMARVAGPFYLGPDFGYKLVAFGRS